MKKGAFIVGANYGRGFVSCRKGRVGWSAPAGIRVEGGSVGFQIGGSETDVVMLVLNKRGADKLMSSKFTLGGDASVAAGPVGRTTTAETDALMHAEILSWSRSRGVFAGIALKGATLRADADANKELYGEELDTRRIVMDTPAPKQAAALTSVLNRYSSRK
jgi:lipid-binding SYLF domain-containing protein